MTKEVKRPPRDVTIPNEQEIEKIKKAHYHLTEAIWILESISNGRPYEDFPDARTGVLKATSARGYCDDLINLIGQNE